MNIVPRVQAILLKPKEEWVKIKDEPATIQQLFVPYAVILAAIPAVAQFLGRAMLGARPYIGGSWMARYVFYVIFSYVLGLAVIYGFGFIINALAPNFSSAQDLPMAMKLAVYSMTPIWLAGALNIFAFVRFLGWIASLVLIAAIVYAIYLLYLGLSVPMLGTPQEKVPAYAIVSFIIAIVAYFIVMNIVAWIFAFRGVLAFLR